MTYNGENGIVWLDREDFWSDYDSPPSYSTVVSPSPINLRPFVSSNASIITIPVSDSMPDLESLDQSAVFLDTVYRRHLWVYLPL